MTLPSFLVIGAARSGTTSLHHYLGQHPDIYICPVNETNFFTLDADLPAADDPYLRHMRSIYKWWVRDLAAYEQLFDGVSGEAAVGEVSPLYMQTLSAPRSIRRLLAYPKLIAVLRHPVDRMYAQLMGMRREGDESRTDLRAVVRAELERGVPEDAAFGSYIAASRYHHWLRGYFELFSREQIRIWLFDDFRASPATVMAEMFQFLGVDSTFAPDTSKRHNATGIIKGPVRRFIWTRSARLRRTLRPYLPGFIRHAGEPLFAGDLVKPPLDPNLRSELCELFRDEIGRLEDLIGRDLGHWLPRS
jgi:hypothetical protein